MLMERKTIFLKLPAEIVEEIDRQNVIGDRSDFITDLLNNQLIQGKKSVNISDETIMFKEKPNKDFKEESIKIVDGTGKSLGDFDLNTEEDFERILDTISEISNNPVVVMKAREAKNNFSKL